jgi:D-alanyl-D-alanine carboxypeptidase (penicillin-binding protein 5/6)
MGSLQTFYIFFLFFLIPIFSKSLDVQIETPHAILINAKTGKILYEKRAKDAIYPASTTKIATALMVIKHKENQLEEYVTTSEFALRKVSEETKKLKGDLLPAYILEYDGAKMDLIRNEKVTYKELLYGLMLASANDAANVLAEAVSGNIDKFVNELNGLLRSIGCIKTNFKNPHGLFHPDHKTCAYDMAVIAREVMKYPIIQEIVKTEFYPRSRPLNKGDNQIQQTNGLIRKDNSNYYPLANGIKTGYVSMAKYNLVASAKNTERDLIAVLHKSPTSNKRYEDAKTLFEAAFCEESVERTLFAASDTYFEKAIPKANRMLKAEISDDVCFKYFPSEEEELVSDFEWRDLKLPIKKGEVVGVLNIRSKLDQRLILEKPFYASEKVRKKIAYIILDEAKANFFKILFFLILLGVAYLVFSKGYKVQ